MYEFISSAPEETYNIGLEIGKLLNKGDVICLSGDLGVGKTLFVKGLAKGLDVKDYITSPTFTIVNEHEGRVILYHFDVYRVNNPDELFEIGFEEYIYGDGVSVIEWAELIESILPNEKLLVKIEKNNLKDENYRIISLVPYGHKYEQIASKIK